MDHYSFNVQKIRLIDRGRTFLFVISNCQGVVVLVSARSCLKCFLLPTNILKKNPPNLWTGSKLFFSGPVCLSPDHYLVQQRYCAPTQRKFYTASL